MKKQLLITALFAATLPWQPRAAAQAPASDASALANRIVASHGGADKLLRTFTFTEVYVLGGKEKGTERTSIVQPPHLWYVGKRERVSQENKGGVCHDVWMWTLGPLVDPKTRLESLPDATIEGKAVHGLKVSGTIEPAMHAFFDAASDDLVKIDWKGEQFFFSSPLDVDGTRVPSKCILIGKTGKERMRTELKKIERLPSLPADLPKPEPAKLPAAVEPDPRLQSNGKGWGLNQAVIADRKLPRVLLIGDSILNGYQPHVIAALKGKAYVDAWVNPYNQSDHLNKLLAEVLERGPYDVIHFNMGLHGWPKGRIKDGTFEPLTRAYVEVIKTKLPTARIIWASSTPTTMKGDPTKMNPEINPIIVEHNRMAANVMNEMKVPINDLYALLTPKLSLMGGDGVHWQQEGSKLMAKAVTEAVQSALQSAAPAPR